MTVARLVLMLVCLMSVTLEPKDAKVTPLLSKDLTDFPGKEGLMITVEYPPGGSDPIHRHNAHAFVYVLEGSIVMQVRGGKEVTLTPGQTERRSRIGAGELNQTLQEWPVTRAQSKESEEWRNERVGNFSLIET